MFSVDPIQWIRTLIVPYKPPISHGEPKTSAERQDASRLELRRRREECVDLVIGKAMAAGLQRRSVFATAPRR